MTWNGTLMATSHRVLVAGLGLVLALAGAAPTAAGGGCDRARSIFAERDRAGEVAATRPTRPCPPPAGLKAADDDRGPMRRQLPEAYRTSPRSGFNHDPFALSQGFNRDPFAMSRGFNSSPRRP